MGESRQVRKASNHNSGGAEALRIIRTEEGSDIVILAIVAILIWKVTVPTGMVVQAVISWEVRCALQSLGRGGCCQGYGVPELLGQGTGHICRSSWTTTISASTVL